ncbi:DNA helicase-2 / ATP-dependent DNA helicase PcrA [Desulfurella multipotens]|uniref:DNA 3'-5' helicase n=1 Tax=Desulfurella multipotens TaxID=79269 RepID=A0A1G6RXU6_9BACT|nr:ATP-dependent DNA helicase [Desulfurella multipotens]SDD08756.1 DNA helicase-2 / ATP-dependent DNA helicase PcrA [Desulfurella multipotens]
MNALEEIKGVIPSLNEDQIEAITTTDGPVLIIAGPGTGKTLTLVARTLYLLVSGKAQPEEIMLTTFTEKAAYELRDRVSQLARKINYQGQVHLLKMGTIHSLCNEYIMKFLSYTILQKGYSVLDELTQVFFVYENFDEIITPRDGKFLGRWSNKWNAIKEIIPYLNKIIEEIIDISQLENSGDEFLGVLSACYKAYCKKLFESNRVDFSHLQKIFYELLNNNEIYQKIKSKIRYIMVDEYQDTNYIQEQIILKLATPENNVCVVGDEDQSLYRFRGATVRNILEFPKHFNNCKQIKLTVNYRSHKKIIERYNKFITSINWDGFRYPKEIKPDSNAIFPEYPAVFCIWGKNEEDEAKRVVQLIKFLKSEKIIEDWSDVAILLKSVKPEHSSHYIQTLKENNIPYFSPRAKVYFENIEVKLLLACYSIIFGFYGDILKNSSIREYIEEAIKLLGEVISSTLKDYIKRKVQQIEKLKEDSLDLTILDYFYQLLAYQPFSSFLNDKNKAYNLSIFSKLISVFQYYYNISVVTSKNKEFIKYHLFGSFFNFLIQAGIDEYEDPYNPIPKGFVQIMTIHQAKGLEFPVVIVGSLHKRFAVQKQVDRDLLPFSKRGTFETERQMTEFDRLRHYYVAFSRAQKLLVLTTPEKPQDWFSPIWEELGQYPYVEKETLKAQKFNSKPQFIPKKSYSLSQINVYQTCPQQYLFYKEYDFQPSRSAQVLFGSLVHHTIEDIHRAVLDKKDFTTSDIENWLEQNYKALLLSGLRPISQTQKEVALKQVINYFKQNQDILERISETEVDVSVEKEDYIITGKIDLLTSKDGKFEILDFKTPPKQENNSELIDRYFKQLCLYGYILKERYGKPVEKMYIYWTSEERRKDALMEMRYSEKDVEEAGRYFDEVVRKIKEENFKVSIPPDTEKVCRECDFRFYCSQNGIIKFKTKELEEV